MSQRTNKYRAFLIVGMGLLLLRASFAFPDSITIDSAAQFDFARNCMERGEYEMAVGEFERFIYFFPHDPRVPASRRLIGICYLKDRRFEATRKIFFKILDSGPDSLEAGKALLFIGESYYQQGIPTEAAYYFNQIIEKYPHLDLKNTAFYRLGWIRMQESQWKKAFEAFSRVEEGTIFYKSSLELAKESLLGDELAYKSPACAGSLAAMMPGMGHAYVSRYRDAVVAFLLNGLFVWAAAESFHQDHDVLGGILTFLEVGWYAGNIYSAVNCAHKHNRKLQNDFINKMQDQFDIRLFAGAKGRVGLAFRLQF